MTLAGVKSRWLAGHVALGALLGVSVLHPATSVIYWWFETPDGTLRHLVAQRLVHAFAPAMLPMTGLFAAIGAALGLVFAVSYRARAADRSGPAFLERERARPLAALLHAGESEQAEFKASARWDAKQGKVNRDLEAAVVRTIAGFLNHRGGTLLVGVGDSGEVIGVQDDYRTLKRPDRDGFEQFVVTLVKTRLGGDVCPLVHVEFQGVKGKDVCRILVEPAPRPVYCREEEVARYFLRAGNSTRELDVREAMAHAAQRWPARRGRAARDAGEQQGESA